MLPHYLRHLLHRRHKSDHRCGGAPHLSLSATTTTALTIPSPLVILIAPDAAAAAIGGLDFVLALLTVGPARMTMDFGCD